MLACSCLLPDGWVNVPLPEETYDLSNPAVFLPLLVCMAPYGAVVFHHWRAAGIRGWHGAGLGRVSGREE
jgi:hypothetical protein